MELDTLNEKVIHCRKCPRLVAWREKVAREKRASFAQEEYWGRPVPGFGDPQARLLVVGLAPAAHGANRTGRMFTGDRSGEWLYRGLYRAGFSNQGESVGGSDGLSLSDCFITAAVRCAPPANKPAKEERDACSPFLEEELTVLSQVRVLVALGKFAYDQLWRILQARGEPLPRPRVPFGHRVEVRVRENLTLLASFHPSQQNTFTGKLTEEMFDAVWARARELLSLP
jgi:uracil-DNA glycosylase family 4